MSKKAIRFLTLSLLMMANYTFVSEAATVYYSDGWTNTTTGNQGYVFYAPSSIIIAGKDVTLSTEGNYAHAISANNGGNVTVGEHATITTKGNMAHGLMITLNSEATLGDYAAIFTTGDSGAGVSSNNNSKVTLGSNATITTDGVGATGVSATNGGNAILGDHAIITTKGFSADGVSAHNGGNAILGDHATISTTGGDYANAVAAATNSEVTLGNNATISTDGRHAKGVFANLSVITLGDNAAITTKGDMAFGVNVALRGEVTLGDNTTITTEGTTAHGVYTENSGKATLGDNTTITTEGTTAHGVHVYDNSGVTFGDNTTISTKGSNAYGLYARDGGNVTFGDVATITTEGPRGYGVYTYNNTEVGFGDSATISTKGDYSAGLIASNVNSKVTFGDNATIATEGRQSNGVSSYDKNGNAEVTFGDNATISTKGEDSRGIFSSNSSEVTLGNNAIISTEGNNIYGAQGVYALEGGKVTFRENATITTKGSNADGVSAYKSGEVTFGEGATISTGGDFAAGVFASNSSEVTFGNNTSITTTGDGAHGVYNHTNSDIFLNSGAAITTTGTNAHGIYGKSGSTTTLNGATIWVDDSKGSNAIYAVDTANVSGSGVFHITGDIVTDLGGTIDLALLSGSQFIGASDVGTGTINLDLSDTAQWQMTKDSTVTKLGFLSGGNVSFDTAANYGVLTVDHLVGDGGTFRMRTDIVGDGAGNNAGDFLEVTGTSAGNHQVVVQNNGAANATGDETLTIIRTADGVAQFTNRNVVELGGYDFNLRDVAGSNQKEWELFGKKTPVISQPGSAAVNLFAGSYLLNYAETQTLMKRMGDLRDGDEKRNIWGRVFGGKFHSDTDGSLKDFDMTYTGVQVGADKKFVRKDGKGVAYLGGFFGYTKGDIDYGYGSGDVDSKSIGAYWTHMHHNGFYADAVFKYGWMKNDFDVLDSQGTKVTGDDISTRGFTGSFEVGRRYHFDQKEKNGWYVEPQAQLTVSQQNGDHFTASNGLNIKVDAFRSVMGRVGTHLGYEVKGGKNPINVYGKVSVVKEFDGDVNYSLNGSKEMTSYKDTWVVYGVGATAKLGTRHNLYLDVERATGGQFTQSWAVNGGYRFSW